MKIIIIAPNGETREFNHDDFVEFYHCLFSILAGIPKCVEVEIDKDFNEIYHVSYA